MRKWDYGILFVLPKWDWMFCMIRSNLFGAETLCISRSGNDILVFSSVQVPVGAQTIFFA